MLLKGKIIKQKYNDRKKLNQTTQIHKNILYFFIFVTWPSTFSTPE